MNTHSYKLNLDTEIQYLKGVGPKREYKLTLSKALDHEAIEGKERSLASVRRARLKEKKNQDSQDQQDQSRKKSWLVSEHRVQLGNGLTEDPHQVN